MGAWEEVLDFHSQYLHNSTGLKREKKHMCNQNFEHELVILNKSFCYMEYDVYLCIPDTDGLDDLCLHRRML